MILLYVMDRAVFQPITESTIYCTAIILFSFRVFQEHGFLKTGVMLSMLYLKGISKLNSDRLNMIPASLFDHKETLTSLPGLVTFVTICPV